MIKNTSMALHVSRFNSMNFCMLNTGGISRAILFVKFCKPAVSVSIIFTKSLHLKLYLALTEGVLKL